MNVQALDVSLTLDSNGMGTVTFPSAIDQVVAGATWPLQADSSGPPVIAVAATPVGQTPTTQVHIRVWQLSSAGANTIASANNRQCTVTLIGYTH